MSHLLGRRRFLTLSLGTAAWLIGGQHWRAAGGRVMACEAHAELKLIRREARALGSAVSFTVLHRDTAAAERAIDAALLELETVEDLMSLYRPQSQLCQLNRTGELRDPHPHLLEVLRTAQAVAESTDGAFDITVQPLWTLHHAAQRAGREPDHADVAAARAKVDYRKLRITPQRITLAAGMAVTLNGIAQGFAADRVRQVLREHDIAHALIDTGELAALGARQDGQPWQVGLQHPRRADAYLKLARFDGRALATSGDYEAAFTDDFRLNHIFDPATGASPTELASAVVAAPTAMLADAWSTALCVLGPQRGGALLERLDNIDALLVLKDGRTFATANFPAVES